jgi:cbb3-type cytochrome oxidase cytochrome c subunit
MEVAMGEKRKKSLLKTIVLVVVATLIVVATGAGSKEVAPAETEVAAEPRVITARFTDPVDLPYQNSEKCIACHTKTHPINKLASPSVAGGEAGG